MLGITPLTAFTHETSLTLSLPPVSFIDAPCSSSGPPGLDYVTSQGLLMPHPNPLDLDTVSTYWRDLPPPVLRLLQGVEEASPDTETHMIQLFPPVMPESGVCSIMAL